MHMMEALTSLFEATGEAAHRAELVRVIDLITTRMLHPTLGLPYIQFDADFTPLPAVILPVVWGRDAPPLPGAPTEGTRPLENTSPGHNAELAWLLLHAGDVLSIPRARFGDVVWTLLDHCERLGIDHEFGGVYAEGPMDAPTGLTEKQFWQQAEALVGMLDAYGLLGDARYWQAFRNVYDFVFNNLVVMDAGGEWMERVDRRGTPIDPALGHAWKICYHTVRSMVQTVRRLRMLAEKAPGTP
jgi:mannose 2-epimerase